MRILIVNQAYHPDPAATAQHAYDLARALVAAGHQVTVVASRSVYGTTGAALPTRETEDGVEIRRVGLSLFGKKSLIGRIADFGLFYVLASVRMLTLPRHDVVICLTTPPFIGLAGWLTTRLRGGRLVSWLMDLYPEVAVAGGVMKANGPAHRLFGAINRFILAKSARVVVLGRCMQGRIRALGVAEDKIALIGPWAAEETAPAGRAAAGARLTAMYSGNLGLAHDTTAFKQAMLRLKDDAGIRFVFSGGGKKRRELEAFAQAHGLTHVSFLPYLPRQQLAEQLAKADVHLISQSPAFTGLVVPSKLYGVLAAQRPAAVVAPEETEIALVVRESGCGEVFAPDEAGGNALADWLVRLAENPDRLRELGAAAGRAHEMAHRPKLRLGQWVGWVEGRGK